MPERMPEFQNRSLESVLFKGRRSWYFCYLKSEKIAHALSIIAGQSTTGDLDTVVEAAANIPQTIAHLAADEVTPQAVLADIFGLISLLRICATRGYLYNENALVLVDECEQIVEKINAGIQQPPFLSTEDFLLSEMPNLPEPIGPRIPELSSVRPVRPIKDIYKGHDNLKDSPAIKDKEKGGQEGNSRALKILDLVKEQKSLSIKDISAVIRGCSEKTIQRELSGLIEQGLVRKVGERRWSTYVPA